jgi:hypothetical protein
MKRLLGEIIRVDKLHKQSSNECLVAWFNNFHIS